VAEQGLGRVNANGKFRVGHVFIEP
jgi:hypothetical protein